MFNKLQPYNKFLVALLGAVLTTVAQFYGNNPYVVMVLTLATAMGVWRAPNKVG